MKAALFVIASLLAGAANASNTSPAEESAYACAKSIHSRTGSTAFEVVRMTWRSGEGNFHFWMNSHDERVGAYCATSREEVTQVYTKASPWEKTNLYKPEPLGSAGQ